MLTRRQYRQQLHILRVHYRINDSWGEWRDWEDETPMDNYIEAAYNLYEATANNRLQLTILGDTKLRSMADIIMNFGLFSAAGVQEATEVNMVQQLDGKRGELSNGLQSPFPPVLGLGSILSDKMWTPILNDSLMIGAIEGDQQFLLGLTENEQKAWNDQTFGFAGVRAMAEKFGGASKAYANKNAAQDNWQKFLAGQTHMFWNNGFPRVLAREVLALKFFGYVPKFSPQHLGFLAGPTHGIGQPNFYRYKNALIDVGYYANDRMRVLGAISEFLFGNAAVLQYGSPGVEA